jgi:hypothetical protein
MASGPKPLVLTIADGGSLNTDDSMENVSPYDFTRILNMRHVKRDQLGRQEGWVVFDPYPDGPSDQYSFDGTESLLRLAELRRADGTKVVVGASRTKIKAFDTATAAWTSLNGSLTFSADGKRWQACTVGSYLILNNTVNLPVSYQVGDAAVTPIYEMRQAGYANVERIADYNGFLRIVNLNKIKDDQLDVWLNGYSSYTATGTTAKAASFSIVFSTDHQEQFDVTTGASDVVATLPAMAFDDQPFYVWIKKVDSGAGTVTTSPAIADEEVVLEEEDDTALVWWNGNKWVAKVFPGGTIPATDPYGVPPESICQRYPGAVANSELGEPTHWAPLFTVLMPVAGTTIVLPFNPNTWVAGQTRVAVINGGPSGATLGGQTGYEDGILVTAISAFSAANMGVTITLEVTTDTNIAYPRMVDVTRWTDISTIVSEYTLPGDGSAAIGAAKLGELFIIYRTTCIVVDRYTGDVTNPFVQTFRYAPNDDEVNLPLWGDAIATVNGEYHLYPGMGSRFYKFDGVSWPSIHETCDKARQLFFDDVVINDECFAVTNPFTKQVWFCRPDLTFAYDTEHDKVTEFDAEIAAAALITRPGTTDRWFILAIDREVLTYGLTPNAATPVSTFLRKGVAPAIPARLTSGLISGASASNLQLMTEEKMLHSYCPVLSSSSPDVAVEVQLRSTYNPSGTLTDLLVPVQELPNPAGENFFTTYFQAIFFQDEITLVDERDIDFQISQRVLEIERIGSAAGVTRRVT